MMLWRRPEDAQCCCVEFNQRRTAKQSASGQWHDSEARSDLLVSMLWL